MTESAGGSAMRLVKAHHVAIATSHFERLRAFYAETLGLPVVGGFPGHDILFLDAGGTRIELDGEAPPADGPRRGGWHHLAWEVADVDAAYAELTARGVPFHVPPEDFPRASRAPRVRIAFVTDPDGNVLELLQPLHSRQ
jgi:catechol 2,3-dioxygenase-like lactoylglutathione lyase family enzyme